MPRTYTTPAEPIVAVRKETPPARPQGPGRVPAHEKYADALAAVKAEPGEWFAILDYADREKSAVSMAGRLRKTTEGFEFVARAGVVYGRYTNGQAAP